MVDNEETTPKHWTEKKEKFARAMAQVGAVAMKCAEDAGYCRAGLASASNRLANDPAVVQRISELKTQEAVKVGITEAKTLADLEAERVKAMDKGDISTAVAATKLMMQYLGLLKDNVVFEDVSKVKQLSEKEAEEARRIAQIRLRDCG